MQLMIDFSKIATLDAIKAEILTFLKDNMVQSGTVFYEIQESGKGGSPVKRMHYIMDPAPTLDTHAGMIAADLADFATGSNGRLYSGATLEIQ